jgi:hypothetical protein
MVKPRRSFTREFKVEAVKLVTEPRCSWLPSSGTWSRCGREARLQRSRSSVGVSTNIRPQSRINPGCRVADLSAPACHERAGVEAEAGHQAYRHQSKHSSRKSRPGCFLAG